MDQSQLLQIMAVFTGVSAVALVITMIAAIAMAWSAKKAHERTSAFLDQAEPLLKTANVTVEKVSAQATDILGDVKAVTASSKQKIEKVDSLVDDLEQNARVQMKRLDEALQLNLDRVNDTTAQLQSTVLVPVRQIRGVAAAVGAVLGALAGKPRPTVDRVTIDEEMFI